MAPRGSPPTSPVASSPPKLVLPPPPSGLLRPRPLSTTIKAPVAKAPFRYGGFSFPSDFSLLALPSVSLPRHQ